MRRFQFFRICNLCCHASMNFVITGKNRLIASVSYLIMTIPQLLFIVPL